MIRLPMIRLPMIRWPPAAIPFTLAALLAACAPQRQTPTASAGQSAACRQRADEVYNRQNRADIYRADSNSTSSRDAAFSGVAPIGITAQLSARYARDQMYESCLRGAARNVASTPDAPVPTGVPPSASKP